MKRKVLIITAIALVVLIIGTITISRATTTSRFKEQVDLGNKYIQEGNYNEAVLAFEKAIKIDKKSVDARLGLAKAYIGLERYDDAERVLQDAISINKKKVEPYIELANLYIKQDKISQAIDILKEAYDMTQDTEIKKLLEELTKPKSPILSLNSGEYQGDQIVEFTNLDPGEEVYYTLDGTEPTTSSTKYQEPIQLKEGSVTVRAIKVKDGSISDESKYEYNIKAKPVVPIREEDFIIENIEIWSTRDEVIAVFGEPVNISTWHDEFLQQDFVTLEYSFGKVSIFPGYEKESKVYEIIIEQRGIKGPREIQVGDSVDSVLGKFPDERTDPMGTDLYGEELSWHDSINGRVYYEGNRISYIEHNYEGTFLTIYFINDKVTSVGIGFPLMNY